MFRLILGGALVASLIAGGWFSGWPWKLKQSETPSVPTEPVTSSSTTTSTTQTDNRETKKQTNVPPPAPVEPAYAPMSAGTFTKTIVSGGLTRTYHITIPTGYDPKNSYPLVFLFHGGNSNGSTTVTTPSTKPAGETFLASSGYMTKANSEKFIVVAPDGVDGNWNDGRGVTEPELQGIDDVAFVKDMVALFETTYNVDSKRIYATGMSNGAMLSARLGCEVSSIFAAVAPVSGALPLSVSQNCNAAVSVVGIQGTNDPFAPMPDSDGTPAMTAKLNLKGETLTIADTQAFWAKEIGCSATPTIVNQTPTVNDGTSVAQHTYKNCSSGLDVVFYIVTAMGHSWPPNTPASLVPIVGPSSKNIVATDVTWNFFKAHSKK